MFCKREQKHSQQAQAVRHRKPDSPIPSKGRQAKSDAQPATGQMPGGFSDSVAAQNQVRYRPIGQRIPKPWFWRAFGYFSRVRKVPRPWVRKVNWPKAKRGRPGPGTHKEEGRFRPLRKSPGWWKEEGEPPSSLYPAPGITRQFLLPSWLP